MSLSMWIALIIFSPMLAMWALIGIAYLTVLIMAVAVSLFNIVAFVICWAWGEF